MPIHEDVVYVERATGPLHLDLFVPQSDEPTPVIVFLHGGGWFTGDRRLAPDLREHFCDRGFAMASVDYRLSGEALFPAQLHDVRAAVRHLRAHADDYRLDPRRIGAWGASAGGHLAAMAGLTSTVAALPGESDASGDASVQAVAESYGPATLVAGAVAAGEPLPGMASTASPEARLIGGDPAELTEKARAASPLEYVTPTAPPFQISHGTGDQLVVHQHSVLLYEALAGAGVDADLYLLDGYRHGFLNQADDNTAALAEVMDLGRLAAERVVTARHLSARGTVTSDTFSPFGFGVIGDFFAHHLGPRGARVDEPA